jgi:hypothetical protein
MSPALESDSTIEVVKEILLGTGQLTRYPRSLDRGLSRRSGRVPAYASEIMPPRVADHVEAIRPSEVELIGAGNSIRSSNPRWGVGSIHLKSLR